MKYFYRDKPYYTKKGIGSLSMLSKTLDIPTPTLIGLTKNQSQNYYEFQLESKNGKVRRLNDPKRDLKKLQKRINSRIFVHIDFPQYLHGGIKKKDYYSNANTHTKSEYIFSYDIRSFYDNIKIEEVYNIFKYLCKFSPEVSDILSKLVTFKGRVPQGAPTSSYVANLIFFEDEYKLVSKLRNSGIKYTRLLDDIVISSKNKITAPNKTKISKQIAALASKNRLKLNNKKTKFIHRNTSNELMYVTGLWVNHANPKCKKEERKNIRTAVHQCEFQYGYSDAIRQTDEYHTIWNQTSGRVAKLDRVGHKQAKKLRNRLSKILPTFSDEKIGKIEIEINQLAKSAAKKKNNLGFIKRVNRMLYYSGVVSRTNKKCGKQFRNKILAFKVDKTYEQFWEE